MLNQCPFNVGPPPMTRQIQQALRRKNDKMSGSTLGRGSIWVCGESPTNAIPAVF